MPASDLDRLAGDLSELHADSLDVARAAWLCQRAAGKRLKEICGSMDAAGSRSGSLAVRARCSIVTTLQCTRRSPGGLATLPEAVSVVTIRESCP